MRAVYIFFLWVTNVNVHKKKGKSSCGWPLRCLPTTRKLDPECLLPPLDQITLPPSLLPTFYHPVNSSPLYFFVPFHLLRLFRIRYRHTIEREDLYRLGPEYLSDNLSERFNVIWSEEVAESRLSSIESSKLDSSSQEKKKKPYKLSLIWCIWRLLGKKWAWMGVLKLISDLTQVRHLELYCKNKGEGSDKENVSKDIPIPSRLPNPSPSPNLIPSSRLCLQF